ncbi:MAG TPA: Ig-like domain-containing protein [Ilumatobacteraceae bacterium]|nr:Ig-like domain-containing protein [Ilumatobacteraceae bacterium]
MRTVGRLVITATLITIGLLVQAPAVVAAAPTIEGPERVYTGVTTPLAFTAAPDPVSLSSRLVKLSGAATSSAPCNPTLASPNYTGCITAKFELFPNGNQTVVADYGTIGVTLAGQARINTGTNNSTTFQVIGLLADVNATIATLVYTPGTEEDVPGVPFETRDPLVLEVTSINGDGTSDQAQRTIEIKVENSLDPPELTVPAGPITVTLPDAEYIYPDDGPGVGVDPITVEDPDVEQGEADDELLVILYLDCGAVPGAGIELSAGGGITAVDLAGAVAGATALPAGTITAVLAGIATGAQTLGVPIDVTTLSFDNGGPGVTAVAEISDLGGINDVLSRIWFYPPASDATCTLWYVVTDFGNNGMPVAYTPPMGPVDGFEVPSLDPTDFIDVDFTVFEVEGNGAPDAVDDAYATDKNTPLDVPAPGVLVNDSDPDGDTITVVSNTDPANGSVTGVNADGSFSYTPDLDYVGLDSFTVTIEDEFGATDTSTVTIEVVDPDANVAPVAADDNYSTPHDTALVIAAPGVLGNDTDADADALTVTLDTDVTNGTLTLNSNGSFTYTPDAGYVGSDSFIYDVSDGNGGTDQATVTIDVTNAAPVAGNDSYSTDVDVPLVRSAATGVLANDTDTDGDTLTVTVDTDVTNGTLTLNPNGSFTYTPDAGYLGSDQFTYDVSDGLGGVDTATVTIEVLDPSVNSSPVAVDDNYGTRPGTTLTVTDPGILTNDTDADSDPLSVIGFNYLSANGTLNVFADGSFDYTPDLGFTGTDTFTYTASDGFGGTDEATVTIDVVNNDPVAVADNYTTLPGTLLNVPTAGVLTNDTDADGDPLSVIGFNYLSANGTLNVFADGSFDYTPDLGFTGTDTFTYTASDGFGGTDQATVTIDVRLNEPPVLTDDDYVTLQDSTLTVPAPGVLGNDTDPDGDTLTVTLATPALLGTLTTLPDGSFTYIPDPGEVGTETVTISVFDGIATETSTLTIEILPRVVITVPPDITVPNDAGQAGAVVTYASPTSIGGALPVTIACTRASGVFYPLGATTVTCTATDSTSDADADSFTITVVDVEPPTIADRPDISVTSTSATPVSYEPPAASDNSGAPPTVVCVPASGSTFPLGVTTVTCTATDGAGNTASSSFTVTVTPPLGDPTPTATPAPPPGGLPPVITPTLDGQLPETGGGSPALLRIGAVVLLLGAALVLAVRSSATMSQRKRRIS